MNASAYPLQWPEGWPRTESFRRERGVFKTELSSALAKLGREITLMGGKQVVLSSNCTLGNSNPQDPGVVAYFVWNGNQLAVPCDRWSKVSHNVQAIALTIEAMRGMERWGAKHMIKAMFTGFKALPMASSAHWASILGVEPNLSSETIRSVYLGLVKKLHPDAGGNASEFRKIQAAYEAFKAERNIP